MANRIDKYLIRENQAKTPPRRTNVPGKRRHHELVAAIKSCTNSPGKNPTIENLEKAIQEAEGCKWNQPVADVNGDLSLPLEHWACLYGKYIALQWLKTNESKFDFKFSSQDQTKNCTALHSAIQFVDRVKTKHTNVKRAECFGKVLDVLIQHNATVLFEKEDNGDTLLHVCARLIVDNDETAPDFLKVIYEIIQKHHPRVEIESLLKTTNKGGDTFLHLLATKENAGTFLTMKQTKEIFWDDIWGKICSTKNDECKTPQNIAEACGNLKLIDSGLFAIQVSTGMSDKPEKFGLRRIASEVRADNNNNNNNNTSSSDAKNRQDERTRSLPGRGNRQQKHLPFCKENCKDEHNPLILSLSRCTNNRSSEEMGQFVEDLDKYLGNVKGAARASRANADLKEPCCDFPIVHWACALGKHAALEEMVKRGGFNLSAKCKATGETALQRAVRCLDRGMGSSAVEKVSKVFSEVFRILAVKKEIFQQVDEEGYTVFHTVAIEMKRHPQKFRYLREYLQLMLSDLSKTSAEEVLQVLGKRTYNEQNFLHILASVEKDSNGSIKKLLEKIDSGILYKLLSVKDSSNETPQNIAKKKGNHELANAFSELLAQYKPAKNFSVTCDAENKNPPKTGIGLKRKFELLSQKAGVAEENLVSKRREMEEIRKSKQEEKAVLRNLQEEMQAIQDKIRQSEENMHSLEVQEKKCEDECEQIKKTYNDMEKIAKSIFEVLD